MNDVTICRRGCRVWERVWSWWTGPRTPRHRLAAYLIVSLVAAAGVWRVETTAHRTDANVAAIQADREARILQGAANNYRQCQATNAATTASDTTLGVFDTVLALAGQLGAETRTPDQQAQVEANLARLRQPLVDARKSLAILDCSVYLRDLTPEQRQTVINTTVPPTLPRPHN